MYNAHIMSLFVCAMYCKHYVMEPFYLQCPPILCHFRVYLKCALKTSLKGLYLCPLLIKLSMHV
jgi:hypothetical protein